MNARIGFGLDHQYASRYPGGVEGLVTHFQGRLSHLSIVGLLDLDDARAFKAVAGGLPILHHLSNIAPADPAGPDLERLARQDEVSGVLGASFCGEDIGVWSLGPYKLPYFVPPLFDEQVLEHTIEGVKAVMERSRVPFVAEVPSCSFVAGTLPLGQFFEQLTERAGCGMVLDLSHVYAYALATDASAHEVLDSMPLERAWEVHIAGGHVHQEHGHRYVDTHSEPIVEVVFELLDRALPRLRSLRAVTYEIGNRLPLETIEADFGRVEQILSSHGFSPSLGTGA